MTEDPAADPWAQRADEVAALMTARPEVYRALKEMPAGASSVEWPIEQTRAAEAAARIFWPLGNTRLDRRLPLIEAPTLVLWGEHDRLLPRSYAHAMARAIWAEGLRCGSSPAPAIWRSSTSPMRLRQLYSDSWARRSAPGQRQTFDVHPRSNAVHPIAKARKLKDGRSQQCAKSRL